MDRMEKGRKGWTKAQAPTRRRPNSEYAKSSENAPTSSAQFVGNTDGLPLILGPGFEVLSSTPKMSPSSRQLPTLVKGKKNLARFKTSNSFYKSTAAPQTKEYSLNSPFSFNNCTTLFDHALKPPSSAPFEFKTLTRGELGHTTRGGNDRGTKDCYCGDLGKSHEGNGKLHLQVQDHLKINLLSNGGNLEFGDPAFAKPFMEADGKPMATTPWMQ